MKPVLVHYYSKEFNGFTTHYKTEPWYIAEGIFGGKEVSVAELVDNNRVPWYYGISYYRLTTRSYVMYPKPINHIVRLIHWFEVWYWLPVG